ncbi:hypothetical protein [Streptomyces clavuligerus]|uniref:hypothetical protein n=1 Tax=Streptomyces clavuligerus TaxID=1901 RepID=UPI0018D041A7|nr:hypothetical protein [Streptomyces clavuligerus]
MRDLIVCAFTWALRLLLPAEGRHRTTTHSPAPETHGLTPEQRERFYATAWAENGYDYTYVATSGVHQAHAGACT